MATLSGQVDAVSSSKYLTATLTYATSTTDAEHTLTLQSLTIKAVGINYFYGNYRIYYGGSLIMTLSSNTNSTLTAGKSATIGLDFAASMQKTTRTTSTQSKELAIYRAPQSAPSSYTKKLSTNISVAAKPSYTISYNGNGATSGSMTASTKWYNTSLTLKNNTFTRTNYSFAKWNTLANGNGTNYGGSTGGGTYTANASATMYAQWTQIYATPQASIAKAYRCDSGGTPDDGGTYAAVDINYQIWKTSSQNSVSSLNCALSTPQDSSYTGYQTASAATSNVQANNQWTKTENLVVSGNWLSGTCKFVINAGLNVDNAYNVVVTLTDAKNGTSGYSSGVVKAISVISPAFYTLDILGDRFLYRLTTDTAIDPAKTYYTRSGQGSEASPYVFTKVASPVASNLLTYYEANGMRPGHGVTFFGTANQEGLHIYNVADNTFGNVTGRSGDESGVLTIHSNILDTSTTSSSDVAHRLIVSKDKNERVIGSILSRRMLNENVLNIEAHNNRASDDAAIYNGLFLKVADDGTRTVTVTDPAAWRNGLSVMGYKLANGYAGIMFPGGSDSGWVRTSTSGLLPYASGGGSSSLGSSTWPFTNLYAQNIYHNGTKLGNIATQSSLGWAAGDASATNSSAQSAGSRFTVNITVGVKSGMAPIAVVGVWASNNQVFSRGFDLDGISSGGSAVVKTYWQANAAITASQVTFSAQVIYLQINY